MHASEQAPRVKRPRVALDTKRVSWRSDWLSDWTCVFGDRRYSVHRVVLAGGPHACHFFAAAFDCAGDGSAFQSNVTKLDLLFPDCVEHALIEDVLDFIYGEEFTVDIMHVCTLLKIADVLQCPALQRHLFDFTENLVEPSTRPEQDAKPRTWWDWEKILIPKALELGVDKEFLKLLINAADRRELRQLAPHFAKCPHLDLRETVFVALSERLMNMPCHKANEKFVHMIGDSDVIVYRNGTALQKAVMDEEVDVTNKNAFVELWSEQYEIWYYWSPVTGRSHWSLDYL